MNRILMCVATLLVGAFAHAAVTIKTDIPDARVSSEGLKSTMIVDVATEGFVKFEVSAEFTKIASVSYPYWYSICSVTVYLDGEVCRAKDNAGADVNWFYGAFSLPPKETRSFEILIRPGSHQIKIVAEDPYGTPEFGGAYADATFTVDKYSFESVEHQETIYDWCKLVGTHRLWHPGDLAKFEAMYGERISKNGNDYEARLLRAAVKIAGQAENERALKIIEQCGYTLDYYTMNRIGKYTGLENTPLPNDLADEMIPEVLATLSSALEDLKAIPEDWSGRLELNQSDWGLSNEENPFCSDNKIYIGLAEVSLARASVELARGMVQLVQGYDFEADYLAISNATVNVKNYSKASELAAIVPNVGNIRNAKALLAAKADFNAALASILRADAAIMNRGDYDTYLVEYDDADAEDIEECRKLVKAIKSSIDNETEIDLSYLIDKYDTTGSARAELPGGEMMRPFFLGALFAGTITRDLVPEVMIRDKVLPARLMMDSITDPTVGGLLPGVTISDIATWNRGNQGWSFGSYMSERPKLRLLAGASVSVEGIAERDADLTYKAMMPGELLCYEDSEVVDHVTVGGEVSRTIQAEAGSAYSVLFESSTTMTEAKEVLIVVTAAVTNSTSEITVPEGWLEELAVMHDKPAGANSYRAAFVAKFGDDLAAALKKPTGKYDLKGNPLQVWQDYVAGTNPLDEEDQFLATVTMENGHPIVKWTPELTPEQAAKRKYTTYGATALNGSWTDVSALSDDARQAAGYQFFKVTVEMK